MTRRSYLTIDDGPSADFAGKVAFLRSRRVPAVFFCIGQRLAARQGEAIDAIRQGYVIANHSFSHPRFSTISTAAARAEIAATDAVIDDLYHRAGAPRPQRLFRFPFGDKGVGSARLRVALRRTSGHFRAIDAHLRALGYAGLPVRDARVPFPYARRLLFGDADTWWTFDVREWCVVEPEHPYPIRSASDVLARVDRELLAGSGLAGTTDVVLLHDDERTADLFRAAVDRMLQGAMRFALPDSPRPRMPAPAGVAVAVES